MVSSAFSPCALRRRLGARAFTLLEVLLALALLALMAAILISGGANLLKVQPTLPEDVFWQAVQEARKRALKAEHEIRLKFDKEKKSFVLIDGLAPSMLAPDGFTHEEVPLKEFPVPPVNTADLQVDLLSPMKGGPTIMIAGVVLEAQPVPFVTFYPDGTCSAFRAQFYFRGAAHIVSIDQWTCAPMLTPADQNTP